MHTMFVVYEGVSSGGKMLVSPDCEWSHMSAAESFYQKQILFSMIPILAVFCSFLFWHTVRLLKQVCGCCSEKKTMCGKPKIKRKGSYNATITDKTILTSVLLLFVLYPGVVTSVFSMLSCLTVDGTQYLAVDLQEECFGGRHMQYMTMLGLPQLIVYVVGLPIAGVLVVGMNRAKLSHPRMKYRYAMLYLGYRDQRWWWEVVVVGRKIGMVLISVFGAMLGPDLQCFLALALVFVSIAMHLSGRPYESDIKRHRILDRLEVISLCVSWATFWSGLLFYLGKGSRGGGSAASSTGSARIHEDSGLLVVVSLAILGMNAVTLAYATKHFVVEYMEDSRQRKSRMSMKDLSSKISYTSMIGHRQKQKSVKVAPETKFQRGNETKSGEERDEHLQLRALLDGDDRALRSWGSENERT